MQTRETSTTLPAAGPAGQAIVVSPNDAMAMLSCGRTRLYQLIDAGELESYLDGAARRITTRSIHGYIQRKLDAANKAAPTGKAA